MIETQIKAWMHYQAQALLPWVAHLHCYLHFSIKKKRNVLSWAHRQLQWLSCSALVLTFLERFPCSANSFLLPKRLAHEEVRSKKKAPLFASKSEKLWFHFTLACGKFNSAWLSNIISSSHPWKGVRRRGWERECSRRDHHVRSAHVSWLFPKQLYFHY